MHLLFICSKNRIRSLTAEQLFKNHPQHQARSAGTALDARRRVSSEDVIWANVIFVMEHKHKEILEQRFPEQLKNKNLVNLNITENYDYMDEALVEVLEKEVSEYLKA